MCVHFCKKKNIRKQQKKKAHFIPYSPLVEVWQCRFAAECVADVTARTLTAEAPSYQTIMDLDRKVRDYPLPEGLSNAPKNDIGASFQRCVLEHIQETGTFLPLHLHPCYIKLPYEPICSHPLSLQYFSSYVHPSQLLRTGDHRPATQPSQERLRTILHRSLSCCIDHPSIY